MTKGQLKHIQALVEQLGWSEARLRAATGISVFHRPEDTAPMLAEAIIRQLSSALRRAGGVRIRESSSGATDACRPSTCKQRSFIASLLEQVDLGETEVTQLAGCSSVDDLSVIQASVLINELKRRS